MKSRSIITLPTAAWLLLLGAGAAAAAVTSPDDICPPEADPCVVDRRVVVDEDTNLDFGTRTLLVSSRGRLVLGGGFSDLSCGGLVVEEGGVLDASGRDSSGFDGGRYDIRIHGVCDDDAEPCSGSDECIGECVGGDVVINGSLRGRARDYVDLFLTAAGTVSFDGAVDLSARSLDPGTAGTLTIDAKRSIDFTGRFRGLGRGYGEGGYLILRSDADIRLTDIQFNGRGGDGDGGYVEADADGDVTVSGEFLVNSHAYWGYGGWAWFEGDDVTVEAQSDGSPTTFDLRGHGSNVGFFAGDGGQFHGIGRNVTVGPKVSMSLEAGPGGQSGQLRVRATENLTFDASADLLTPGKEGHQGEVDLRANTGTLRIGPDADIEVGGNQDGGDVDIRSGGPLLIEGRVVNAGGEQLGQTSVVSTAGDVVVSGELLVEGSPTLYAPFEVLHVEGCDVTVASGGNVSTTANGRGVGITARELMTIASGGNVALPGTVSFVNLTYRDPLQAPVVLGTVAPDPNLVLNESLLGCP